LPIDIYRIAYFTQKKKREEGILQGNEFKADAGEGDGRERGGRGDAWAGEASPNRPQSAFAPSLPAPARPLLRLILAKTDNVFPLKIKKNYRLQNTSF